MGHCHNVLNDTIYTAVKLISPGLPSFYAFDNFNPPPGSINLADNFTNAEKFQALSGGVARASAGSPLVGNDVSFLIGEKLPDLLPNQSSTFAVAIIAVRNLADIQASAQAAQLMYTQRALGTKDQFANAGIIVYPNPAHDLLKIKLPRNYNAAETTIELTDALGRKVATPVKIQQEEASVNVTDLAAGLYVLKIRNQASVQTFKVQVRK